MLDRSTRLFQHTVNTKGGQSPAYFQPDLHLPRIADLIGRNSERVAVQVGAARAEDRPVEQVENLRVEIQTKAFGEAESL